MYIFLGNFKGGSYMSTLVLIWMFLIFSLMALGSLMINLYKYYKTQETKHERNYMLLTLCSLLLMACCGGILLKF
jgi:hypothetical protein